MSICTKTGDAGTTGLMYNRRVRKTNPRIEACGAVDELNSALGVVRASGTKGFINERVLRIQKELISLMGELATSSEDLERYEKDGFVRITPAFYEELEKGIREIEGGRISFKDWATPGATMTAAALDMARSICRRAERRVEELLEGGEIENRAIQVYLNRVSDLLWLLARWEETEAG